jgi:hypothetical protein
LRSKLGWMPLSERRRLSRLALVHRCVKKLGPAYMTHMLVDNREAGCRTTRGHNKLNLFQPNTELYRRSFSFMGSKEWNLLPESTRSIQSPVVFKQIVRQWLTSMYSNYSTVFIPSYFNL